MRIVKLNLSLGQADDYQILVCVMFPLSGAAPNATCASTIPGKQFSSRADTSACVSSVPPGGLLMSLTMILNFNHDFSLIVGFRSDPIHPIYLPRTNGSYRVQHGEKQCPVCRARIENVSKAYISWGSIQRLSQNISKALKTCDNQPLNLTIIEHHLVLEYSNVSVHRKDKVIF